MATFFELNAKHIVGEENQIVQLNTLFDWECLRHWLKGMHRNEEHREGMPAYDSLMMLKAILLGQWHSLSDPELERCLRTRLDFMLFTGFGLDGKIPDETTLCRFRNKLFHEGRAEKIFSHINRQLSKQGLSIEKAKGAIIDATIIESAAKPERMLTEHMAVDRKEDTKETSYQMVDSIDPDAKWLKKGKRCYFGYKGFVSTEGKHGFIQNIVVTAANQYEGSMLEAIIAPLSAEVVLADKGYAVGSNREFLRERGVIDGIMRKATRGSPLSKAHKLINKQISKYRFKVEQCFGTLKRRFNFSRASYFSIEKVTGQFYLKAICFNMLKAKNLLLTG